MLENLTHIGTISAPFGVKGAIKLYTIGDPHRLLDLERVWLEGRGWLKVQIAEAHGPAVMYKFLGVDSREGAELLKTLKVYAADDELPPLEDDEFYHHQLVGLPIRSLEGEDLGRVKSVIALGSGDLLECSKGFKIYLVPLQAPYVKIVRGREIVLDAPEGLIED